jgi:hypothetical protein
MHESNFHVIRFTYGSNTRDAMGRVSRSRADFDVAATASRWILAATPLAGHPGQSSSTLPLLLGQKFWPPPWAPLAGGQDPPWGMPPWMTSTPHRPSSSPPMVRHSCLLSIVTFIIRANVERLANSSIYVFKWHFSSVRYDFTDAVLNVGGSNEGDDGGTGNDVRPWWVLSWYMMYCIVRWLCIVVKTMDCRRLFQNLYCHSIYCCCLSVYSVTTLFLRLPVRGDSQNRIYIKNPIYLLVPHIFWASTCKNNTTNYTTMPKEQQPG